MPIRLGNDSIYSAIGNVTCIIIDIACIQETHNERTDSIKIKEYEIFAARDVKESTENLNSARSNNSEGISIATHETITNYIQKIIRIKGGNGNPH